MQVVSEPHAFLSNPLHDIGPLRARMMPASRFSKVLMTCSPLTPAVPVLIVGLQDADKKIGHAGSIP
jgi:hypothetical protein